MADKLTIDDLLAWGRDYESHLKRAQGHQHEPLHVPRPMLDHFIAAALAALAQQQQREKREKPRSGGRPRGGMGEQKQRLVASGVSDEDADRIVAQAKGRPVASVQRADKRARKKPRKKPPH